jgi:hypothetical protein
MKAINGSRPMVDGVEKKRPVIPPSSFHDLQNYDIFFLFRYTKLNRPEPSSILLQNENHQPALSNK